MSSLWRDTRKAANDPLRPADQSRTKDTHSLSLVFQAGAKAMIVVVDMSLGLYGSETMV